MNLCNRKLRFFMIWRIKKDPGFNSFAIMFKYTTALFLFISFALQTFKGGFVILNYYTNTAAFAENCINKAKPKLQCNGRCQMMKRLQEQEKKDQQIPERKLENKVEIFSSGSFFFNIEIPFLCIEPEIFPVEKKPPLADIAYSFFHPPQA